MNFSQIYYPKAKTFFDYSKVIPPLIEIINQNDETVSFDISNVLKDNKSNEAFLETKDSGDGVFLFELKNRNAGCYRFSFQNSSDKFSLEVRFSSIYSFGMIRFNFNSKQESSSLKDSLTEMITEYAKYTKSRDENQFHLEKNGANFHTDVSLRGFNFGEFRGDNPSSGNGFSCSLKEFIHDKKGQSLVRNTFSGEVLERLILAAKLREKFPYLF